MHDRGDIGEYRRRRAQHRAEGRQPEPDRGRARIHAAAIGKHDDIGGGQQLSTVVVGQEARLEHHLVAHAAIPGDPFAARQVILGNLMRVHRVHQQQPGVRTRRPQHAESLDQRVDPLGRKHEAIGSDDKGVRRDTQPGAHRLAVVRHDVGKAMRQQLDIGRQAEGLQAFDVGVAMDEDALDRRQGGAHARRDRPARQVRPIRGMRHHDHSDAEQMAERHQRLEVLQGQPAEPELDLVLQDQDVEPCRVHRLQQGAHGPRVDPPAADDVAAIRSRHLIVVGGENRPVEPIGVEMGQQMARVLGDAASAVPRREPADFRPGPNFDLHVAAPTLRAVAPTSDDIVAGACPSCSPHPDCASRANLDIRRFHKVSRTLAPASCHSNTPGLVQGCISG